MPNNFMAPWSNSFVSPNLKYFPMTGDEYGGYLKADALAEVMREA